MSAIRALGIILIIISIILFISAFKAKKASNIYGKEEFNATEGDAKLYNYTVSKDLYVAYRYRLRKAIYLLFSGLICFWLGGILKI